MGSPAWARRRWARASSLSSVFQLVRCENCIVSLTIAVELQILRLRPLRAHRPSLRMTDCFTLRSRWQADFILCSSKVPEEQAQSSNGPVDHNLCPVQWPLNFIVHNKDRRPFHHTRVNEEEED